MRLAVLPLGLFSTEVMAGCFADISDAEVFDQSQVVAEVGVLSAEPFFTTSGKIDTRVVLSLVESFKGKLPRTIEITVSGGTLAGRTDYGSDSLVLKTGESYVLMLSKNAQGAWTAAPAHSFRISENPKELPEFFRNAARGERPELTSQDKQTVISAFDADPSGVPASRMTRTGYSETTEGHPTRFIAGDSDDAIPYVIDIDTTKLPTGMNEAGAIAAVAEAFQAWARSSSLKFRYEGTQSFGQSSRDVSSEDRRMRIQLHDNFGAINSSGTLGLGGGRFSVGAEFTAGSLGPEGFQERRNGWVIMESSPLQTDATLFKRVLTHEIGHALGLTHSSQDPDETDETLKNATMYYRSPAGTTGATIQAYDIDRIQFGYPLDESPPVTSNRIIHAITSPFPERLPTNVPGVNCIDLRAFSKNGRPLTPVLISSTSGNGEFSLKGSRLHFTPKANYNPNRLTDDEIANGRYFDTASIQFSDGKNLSKIVTCNLVSFQRDSNPGDGLPDEWMQTNFKTILAGLLGSGSHPDDDPDKDGLSNRLEFILGTDPNSAASGPVTPTYNHKTRQLSFTPVRFASYWVESSTDLSADSWKIRRTGTSYQSSDKVSSDFSSTVAPTREFYRVVTGP